MTTAKYVQGPGVLDRLPELAKPFGAKPLLLLDAGIAPLLEDRLKQTFAAAGVAIPLLVFSGEVIKETLDRQAQDIKPLSADLVIGVGGGKTLDAAKGIALRLGVPMVSVPTIASTDAPASRGLVLYDENHRLVGVEQMPVNPACVVVDTALIAKAPPRYLRAGICDALSKKFEVEASVAARGLTKHRTVASATAIAVADACYRTLRSHAVTALRAAEAHHPDEAFEAVVEACLLMSAMAFENGGLSLAHAMTGALTEMPATAGALHGDHVAYGILLQLALEGRPDAAIGEMIGFYREIGAPASLADLGLTAPAEADLAEMAEINMRSPLIRNTVVAVDNLAIVAAIRRVETLAGAA